MRKNVVCCAPANEALRYCGSYLRGIGIAITEIPDLDMTHLILPIPTSVIHTNIVIPGAHVTICGGNLNTSLFKGHSVVDFLKDPFYLADNAMITAECAIDILRGCLPDLTDSRVLILGWGRIGKCLGKLLEKAGSRVSISARKDADLAMIHALGYQEVPISCVTEEHMLYDAVFNTVPEMILPQVCKNTIPIDLASKPGMGGENVISARGLPGKMAPEKSGELIARTFLRLALDKEAAQW